MIPSRGEARSLPTTGVPSGHCAALLEPHLDPDRATLPVYDGRDLAYVGMDVAGGIRYRCDLDVLQRPAIQEERLEDIEHRISRTVVGEREGRLRR